MTHSEISNSNSIFISDSIMSLRSITCQTHTGYAKVKAQLLDIKLKVSEFEAK